MAKTSQAQDDFQRARENQRRPHQRDHAEAPDSREGILWGGNRRARRGTRIRLSLSHGTVGSGSRGVVRPISINGSPVIRLAGVRGGKRDRRNLGNAAVVVEPSVAFRFRARRQFG